MSTADSRALTSKPFVYLSPVLFSADAALQAQQAKDEAAKAHVSLSRDVYFLLFTLLPSPTLPCPISLSLNFIAMFLCVAQYICSTMWLYVSLQFSVILTFCFSLSLSLSPFRRLWQQRCCDCNNLMIVGCAGLSCPVYLFF